MFYLYSVLIGRHAKNLDKLFTYYSKTDDYEEGMRVLVPFNKTKQEIGIIISKSGQIETLEEFEKDNFKLSPIISKIDDNKIVTENLLKLLFEVSDYYKSDLLSVISTFLPSKIKISKKNISSVKEKLVEYVFANDNVLLKSLSEKEKELYFKILNSSDGIKKSQISAKQRLNNLLSSNYLYTKKISFEKASLIEAAKISPFVLTKEQDLVFNEIINGVDNKFLIEGVTGSGKTNIYIRLIEHYLKLGKGSILLVPEIVLTDNLTSLLTAYFKDDIAVLHSAISNVAKYKEFKKIINGEKKVVVGTRSAIFAPVKDLALIIIDEEHSGSYKQNNTPFYDARQIANFRSQIEDCKVVLGSATPQIVTKAKASKGLYKQLYLKEQFHKTGKKNIHIIDLNKSDSFNPNLSNIFSIEAIEAIKKQLDKKMQTMILINRRGYSPIYKCQNCNKIVECPNCNIPLTYHKKDDTLRCHHCGFNISINEHKCLCNSDKFTSLGFGTERAYEEIKFLFPGAKVYQIDSDVAHKVVRHEILTTFKEGEADILIGTQLIAKGHDFPKVTCAIIVDSDNLLRIPSYLAGEETFDLISQFVGRAGRNNLDNDIYIQTYLPNNEIINLASKQDYETFYKYELEERKKYLYPPYVFLTSIIFKGYNEKEVINCCLDVKNLLIDEVGNKQINFYGPLVPYISYINNKHSRYILIKYKSQKEMSLILDKIRSFQLEYKNVSILINVDMNGEIV